MTQVSGTFPELYITRPKRPRRTAMPKFLETKLKREYPNNPRAVYGTLNAIGAMRGNKETAKGRAMEAKHAQDAGRALDAAIARRGTARRGGRGR